MMCVCVLVRQEIYIFATDHEKDLFRSLEAASLGDFFSQVNPQLKASVGSTRSCSIYPSICNLAWSYIWLFRAGIVRWLMQYLSTTRLYIPLIKTQADTGGPHHTRLLFYLQSLALKGFPPDYLTINEF